MYFDKTQAKRLKYILSKTKASEASLRSFFSPTKENKPANKPTRFVFKQKIKKLKQDVDSLLQKQSLKGTMLVTPRECLEQIKDLSDNIEDESYELEEACQAFLQNLPEPTAQSLPLRKYYLMLGMGQCLTQLLEKIYNRVISSSFDEVSAFYQAKVILEQQETRQLAYKKKKSHILSLLKKSSGFHRWKLAIEEQNCKMKTHQIVQNNGTKFYTKMISVLSSQGKAILWLQNLISDDADATQILIFNPKEGTLRAYVQSQEHLSSAFQTISNVSQTEQRYHPPKLPRKIKMIEFNIQKSLTKICLIKKQILVINELRADPDYQRADNIILKEEITGREMIGGAIFTPLVNSSGYTLGLIRRFFFSKIGEVFTHQKNFELNRLFNYCVSTSRVFESVKEKYDHIEERFYLKGIKIMNKIEKLHENTFEILKTEMLCEFPIQEVKEYKFMKEDEGKFIVEVEDRENKNQLITVLEKLQEENLSHLFIDSTLYVQIYNYLYVLQVKLSLNSIPISIFKDLLEHKYFCQTKYESFIQIKKEKEEYTKMKIQQEENSKREQQVREFFLQQKSSKYKEDRLKICRQFANKFFPNYEIASTGCQVEMKANGNYLWNDSFQGIYLKYSQKAKYHDSLVYSLKTFLEFTVQSIKQFQINIQSMHQTFTKTYDFSITPQENFIIGLKQLFSLQEVSYYELHQNPYQNEFYSKNISEQCYQTILKQGKKSIFSLLKGLPLKQTLNPKCMILCLRNVHLYLFNQVISINSSTLQCLNSVHRDLESYQDERNHRISSQKLNKNITEGIYKLQNKFRLIFHDFFGNLKQTIREKNSKVLLQKLDLYVGQISLFRKGAAFSKIKSFMEKEKNKQKKRVRKIQDINFFCEKIKSFTLKQSGLSHIFYSYKKNQTINNFTQKIHQISNSYKFRILTDTIEKIELLSLSKSINTLMTLQSLLQKRIKQFFSAIKFHSLHGSKNQETECTKIQKIMKINQVYQQIKKHYPHYELYIEIRDKWIGIQGNEITFPYQFLSQNWKKYQFFIGKTIKRIVWLVPSVLDLQLSDKHHLQLISKAIQQTYAKILKQYFPILLWMKQYSENQNNSLKLDYLRRWVSSAHSSVKNEQYICRSEYHEISQQIVHLKQIQKQYKKEEEFRDEQIKKQKEKLSDKEMKVNTYQEQIIKLDVSCRILERKSLDVQSKAQKIEMKRIFKIWYGESLNIKVNKLKDKRLENRIPRALIKRGIQVFDSLYCEKLNDGLRMIMVQSARVKAILTKCNKKSQKKREQDRLVTFQDEMEEQQSQKSFIHLKQFDEVNPINSVKVTEQQASKINKGSYKLNAKTLKFLKRMGKFENQ